MITGRINHLGARGPRPLRDEQGFAMIIAIGVLFVTALLITATFVALDGDAHLAQHDLQGKQAYYAARAGGNAYTYQMNQNSNYWTSCTNDTLPTTAVPGSTTGEAYSYAPVPANGKTACSATDPIGSLIDTATGTLRMKFVGTSGGIPSVSRGIIATYRKASPLDYLWFTQYEALDASISGYTGCGSYYRDGVRNSNCNIYWVSGDTMNGPMYTMDQFLISGSPTFGRYPSDKIASLAPSSICSGGSCGSAHILGTQQSGVAGVTEPSDNSGLLTDATNHGAVYSGTTTISLNGTTANVENCPGASAGAANCKSSTVDLTQKPIIYVTNGTSCNPPAYTPFNTPYPTTTVGSSTYYYGCSGDAYVSGNYSTSVTIASANNIVITGSVLANNSTGTPTGSAIAGLVANQFIRLMHGVSRGTSYSYSQCGSNTDVSGQTLKNPTIDAAILALQHSFIVDNFDCGNPANTGQLNIFGALAQKFRGAVGTGTANTGYLKNYAYDNRLAVLLPPYLFDITTSGWLLSRETLCVPGGPSATTSCG